MTFVPGHELAARFYSEAVRPALDAPHGAALLGPGSDVLGFDTARSTDHGWGPRVLVFVPEGARQETAARLAARLPVTFHGYPMVREPDALLAPTAGVARDGVTVAEAGAWLTGQLGFDPRGGVTTADWLATPTQLLAEVTTGPVFADDLGDLAAARANLAWYPPDVWRHVLACQWQRIAQEEAFVGRTAEVGDELGSAVVAARLARDLMRLWLLMAGVYPPYSKWLGSAFATAPGVGALRDALTAAVRADAFRVREEHLCRAYTLVAERHNGLGLTESVDATPRGYYDRPYRVIDAGRFVTALRPRGSVLSTVGAVDQFVDSTDVLSHAGRARAVASAMIGTTSRK